MAAYVFLNPDGQRVETDDYNEAVAMNVRGWPRVQEAAGPTVVSTPYGVPPEPLNSEERAEDEVKEAEAEAAGASAKPSPLDVTIKAFGGRLVLLKGKRPVQNDWPNLTPTEEKVRKHVNTGGNVGVRAGEGLVILDFDQPGAEAEMMKELGSLTPTVETGSGKHHYYLQAPQGELPAKMKWQGKVVGEIQRTGSQQVVAPPSIHPTTKCSYRWLAEGPEALPALPASWLGYLMPGPEKPPPKDPQLDDDVFEQAMKMPGAKRRSHGIKFQCPKCAEAGKDRSKDNACAMFNGVIGCAVDAGHAEAIRHALGVEDERLDRYHATDEGIAKAFAAKHRELCRYDVDRGTWLLFDGVRWAPDALQQVNHLVADTLRDLERAAATSDSDNKRQRLRALFFSENRIPQILKASVSYLSTRTSEWDTDTMLLGVPNGVVDLRTGKLRPGRPEDHITMQAAVPFNPDAACPLWEKTVGEVFAKDPELVPYIQRAFGYSITGDCRHEVFFLCTSDFDTDSPGREGKGTLINTAATTLGNYADNLGFKSLEQRRGGGEPDTTPDLAKLVHKRFVTASETNGGRFNEARIKHVTGRDKITACFKYKDEFTYIPEFKLWLSMNVPLRVQDEAFWTRPHRIPFRTSFRGREDVTLKDRLQKEREGILAWLVRGCLAWQKEGLNPPAVVTNAVEEYRLQQQPLAAFYEACCTTENPGAWTSYEDLRAAYVRWCEGEHNQYRLGSKRFARELRKRFKEARETTGRKRQGYKGIGLLVPERADVEEDDGPTPF
jgi:putative DNA primase/helicase